MLGGLLLLQPPILLFRGLPGPPDDSLKFPREGGLPTADTPGMNFGSGSACIPDFDSFHPSVKKLPMITCNRTVSPNAYKMENSNSKA